MTSTPPRISVVLCTHNPREEYLRRTLDSLAAQDLPAEEWEVVLVDNASEPPLAGRVGLERFGNARVVVEERLGLSPARLRGIAEAQAPWICFVDDDNVLRPDYLRTALGIAAEHPHLGCLGGRIEGEFEVEPPRWFRRYQEMIAVRPLDRDHWGNSQVYNRATPCGAGMVIRADVARRYAELCATSPLRVLLDRRGGSLASAGDLDMAFTAIDMGHGVGRFTALSLTHLIPRGRLELDYLARLAEDSEESSIYLILLRHPDAFDGFRMGRIATFRAKVRLMLVGNPVSRRIRLARDRGRRKGIANVPRLKAELAAK